MSAEAPVVVIDKETDANFVEQDVATEGQCLANQIRASLAQGIVEALDMSGLARLLADRAMALGRDDVLIDCVEIGVTDGAFAIVSWERCPKLPTGFPRAVADREANDPARLSLKRNPDPHYRAFVPHKRPKLIDFQDRPLGQWRDRVANRCQGFFSSNPAIVRRLIFSCRAMARWESRS